MAPTEQMPSPHGGERDPALTPGVSGPGLGKGTTLRIGWVLIVLVVGLAAFSVVAARIRSGDWAFLGDGRVQVWMSTYRLAILLSLGFLSLAGALLVPSDRARAARAVLAVAAAG